MPRYRLHRLKDNARQNFRFAPHVSGAAQVKRKDYDEEGVLELEAANEYAAWHALKDSDDAIRVGDVLEGEDGRLAICKYVGFEVAEWLLPVVRPVEEPAPSEA